MDILPVYDLLVDGLLLDKLPVYELLVDGLLVDKMLLDKLIRLNCQFINCY